MVFAREGFNVIATANTRDRGVNEMSAALKRRFNFETVFPIADFDTELALVEAEAARAAASARASPRRRGATCWRCWSPRSASCATGQTARGDAMERLTAVMSTAEAVSVAHAVGLRGWFLRGEPGTAADLVDCLAGTAAKDNPEDLARLRRYLEQQAPGAAATMAGPARGPPPAAGLSR